jgi:hypothetical protein
MSVDLADDDGDPIRWMRRCPHLANEGKRMFYHSFYLDSDNGLDSGTVMLRWSNDGGRNWSGSYHASSGAIGETAKRVRWNRLGMGRDRVFEVTGVDSVPVCLIDAYLELEPGNH